jgi:ABC-type cobalamin/Fe3+-siderophores transport system ATPase subunit
MNVWNTAPFEHGSEWVRADFHLHTKADKEFKYSGEENDFGNKYVGQLKAENIRLGLITNHNKFNKDEFKALRKKARKEGICLLPGVELSVNDGANGVHTLIAFSDEWLEDGHDYINQFLSNAFIGKTPVQYEQENGRTSDDLLVTLKKLEAYHRDFFIIFAHVEAPSGLWNEIDGGRMQELAENPLIQKHCLGFQKVRTHDKSDVKCRVKVQQWWEQQYPAEVEGSDPKKLEEIGRGTSAFLKLGDFSFDAVKYALTDFHFRVTRETPTIRHSHLNAIRFEGGLLDGKRVTLSPHLNCLIGVRGSGKSSLLESIRYALNIPFGQKVQDRDYKNELLPHVLKSGGKIIIEATDRHGTSYEIRRIWGHDPDVFVDDELKPGISIKETVIAKPLYFGQKDLSAVGEGFGRDLVEKLVGEKLKLVRQKISEKETLLRKAVENLVSISGDTAQKLAEEEELKDINYRLEQFKKYGIQEKLSRQVEFGNDVAFCEKVEQLATNWYSAVYGAITQAESEYSALGQHTSKHNPEFFTRFQAKLNELKDTLSSAKTLTTTIKAAHNSLTVLKEELNASKDSLKDEFAETSRELVKALEAQGVTSIQPDDYLNLTNRKAVLEDSVEELTQKTSSIEARKAELLKALEQLNSAWHEEFRLISGELSTINAAQSSLQVDSSFKGDKKGLADLMENTFRGHNIRRDTYKSLADSYMDCAEIYKNLDLAATEAKSKSETFKEQFLGNLYELLRYQVPNTYNVTYHGKPLKSHSLGQRASAMMLFILSQKENDLLLIDQPEDDLDNQTIYEEVVKLLRTIKPVQQFIFATHNANFPVLGDAELIASCHTNDNTILVETGSIDDKKCQEKIVNIMEGGPEAFNRRKTIYHLWRAG